MTQGIQDLYTHCQKGSSLSLSLSLSLYIYIYVYTHTQICTNISLAKFALGKHLDVPRCQDSVNSFTWDCKGASIVFDWAFSQIKQLGFTFPPRDQWSSTVSHVIGIRHDTLTTLI